MATEQTGSKQNKKNNFLIQGSILAVAGILVRIIGLAYRIPLIRIIGTEGMGYYSVAFEVYSVILLLSSYSLPLAISKMISSRIAGEDYVNARRTFKAALIYATVIGFIGCMFVFLSADWFANVFYALPLCKYALVSLAPTIWIMSYLGVMRGYYQGQSTMVPTAVSQIVEQIINALVSVGAAWWLCDMALNAAKGESVASGWGAAGGTIGTGAGALSALIVLIILYVRDRKDRQNIVQNPDIPVESYKSITNTLLLTVVPVIMSTAVYNISGIIDATVFSNTMVSNFEMDATSVASDYGTYTGDFKTLINIPIAIANSLSSSLIPTMSKASSAGKKDEVNKSITMALRFTTLIAFPATVGLTILGGPIVTLLFGRSELATQMTLLGSSAVLFYSISTVTNAVLQGNSYMNIPVLHAMLSLVIHIGALLIFLNEFKWGVQGIVIANIVFALSMCIMNAYSMRTKLEYKQDIKEVYLKPLFASLVMGAATLLTRYLIENYVTQSSFWITAICVVVAVAVYGVMILITGCIKKEELKRFPVIRKFV